MQGTGPNGTAIREMSRTVEESEGHFHVPHQRPLFLFGKGALAEPKTYITCECDVAFCK